MPLNPMIQMTVFKDKKVIGTPSDSDKEEGKDEVIADPFEQKLAEKKSSKGKDQRNTISGADAFKSKLAEMMLQQAAKMKPKGHKDEDDVKVGGKRGVLGDDSSGNVLN